VCIISHYSMKVFLHMKTSHKQTGIRPTTGKVREALFDILRGTVENALFLDLYAGTGAVGMNALREGAAEVIFVEENKKSAKKIQEQLKKISTGNKSMVLTKKVLSFIETAELENQKFDIIFLDPPYHTDEMEHAISAISSAPILNRGGTVIAEHFKKKQLPGSINNLKKIKEYNYGDTVLTFFNRFESQVRK